MKLSSNYLNKSYYVATMLQYNDELKKEGFKTETKKTFLLDGEAFIADLYAENEEEKRIYDFQLTGRKEAQSERTTELNLLCASINAKPVIIYVKPPVEKQIVFDELETIINDYFLSGDLPLELSDLSRETCINAVTIDEILTASFEKLIVSFSGCATIFVTLQHEPEKNDNHDETFVCCEHFPLSFDISLDCDYNCKTLEYEIDLSDYISKKEEPTPPSDGKNYISKTRFDTEFKLYQDLSESVLTMTGDIDLLFPTDFDLLPHDETQKAAKIEDRAQNAGQSVTVAGKTIKRYAPFVPKNLFENLNELVAKCKRQLYWYDRLVVQEPTPELALEQENCIKRATEIVAGQSEFMEAMRKYIESLDVK
jgi:hypothetical protein